MAHTEWVLAGGLAIGLVFGAVGRHVDFCLSGGLREWWLEGQPRRAATFLLAVAVATVTTQTLAAAGWIDLRTSLYYQATSSWLLVPLGGILFGVGMIVARGCGSRALVLLGDGNLRSLVVLGSLGIAAAATLTGPLAGTRIALANATTVAWPTYPPALPELLVLTGMAPSAAPIIFGGAVAALLATIALARLRRHGSTSDVIGAVVIGLLPPLGWWVTSHIGADDFDPVTVESLTFVAPIGDSIQYLMLSTGMPLRFSIAVVAGVLLGSLAISIAGQRFALRGFDSPQQMLESIVGGTLMGIGGALAVGCSIGQGLTGISTLAFSSVSAVAGIVAGARLAIIRSQRR